MYKLKEIADKVYYVGVNDRQKALFENMLSLIHIYLVMEEAVSNIIFYAYKGDVEDAVDISLVREGGELIVTLIDHGIAFDPTLRKDPDITLSAEDRPIGGLGIFLIKKIMDEVSYQRVDERNVFIMKKKITE